jgi:hypothetical protein
MNFIAKHHSMSDALVFIGKRRNDSTGPISNCCQGMLKKAHGFIWRYGNRFSTRRCREIYGKQCVNGENL